MDAPNTKNLRLIGVLIFAVAIFLGLLLSHCESQRQIKDLNNKLFSQRELNNSFVVRIKSDSSTIADQKVLIIENNRQVQKELSKISDGLKDIQNRVEIRYITKIESLFVPYDSPVYYLDSQAVRIPLKFHESNKNYFIGGTLKKGGILFDSVLLPNKLSVTIGKERKGYFKKPETIVRVQSSNPYVRIDSMNNVVLKDKKTFYERRSFWAGLSLALGLFLGIKL